MTAVEWLIDELEKWGEGRIKWPTYLWEEAEAMEKEQIIDAYNSGQQIPPFQYAERFYQETYVKSKTPPGEHCEEA